MENDLKPSTIIEVLDAAHLTALVDCPFKQRGGIILVSPPGHMKSTLINSALQGYNSALVMSDINVRTLCDLRQDLISGKFSTLAFTALEKLYARHMATASNIEATLMALSEEGFTRASFEVQDQPMRPARGLIIGGTFPSCIDKMWSHWRSIGFVRRFIWCNYNVDNSSEIINAIHYWKPLQLGKLNRVTPIGSSIPYEMEESESARILEYLHGQDESTPFVLLKKIYAVLKWKYDGNVQRVHDVLGEFSESLHKDGAALVLPKADKPQYQL